MFRNNYYDVSQIFFFFALQSFVHPTILTAVNLTPYKVLFMKHKVKLFMNHTSMTQITPSETFKLFPFTEIVEIGSVRTNRKYKCLPFMRCSYTAGVCLLTVLSERL